MKSRCKLSPSLLEVDYRYLDAQLKAMERAGADCVHIDVMDGMFVPNLSFGFKLIRSIRRSTALDFDVHMMVQEPGRFVERMADAGATGITVHYEACGDAESTLAEIRNCGVRAGLALKPGTALDVLGDGLLKASDVIHLMTVEPGLEGQTFIPESLCRISELREKLDKVHPDCVIEVDGNITFANIEAVVTAGATVIVVGKALFCGDMEENIRRMKLLMDD